MGQQKINITQVDIAQVKGIQNAKSAVRVATDASISLTGTQTVDGIALAIGDRVLVKDQQFGSPAVGSENGIYDVKSDAWTRSTDANTSGKMGSGIMLFVQQGSTNGGDYFVLTTINPIVLDSTILDFSTDPFGAGGGGGINNVIEDLTPQLGGALDVNDFILVGKPAATVNSDGGGISLDGAVGGATSGSGGLVQLTGGPAGATGNGGFVNLIGGVAYGDAKYGGDVNITGGASTYAGDAYGGYVFVTGGAGTSYGGPVTITGGAPTDSAGASGGVIIQGGVGGAYAGNVTLAAGNGTTGRVAGNVLITGGYASSGNTSVGGFVTIQSGSGGVDYKGGNLVLGSGSNPAGGDAEGGDILMTTGRGRQANRAGDFVFTGGISSTDVGGSFHVTGGDSATGASGGVSLTGGLVTGTSGVGGDITLTGGNGGSASGDAGDIILTPGATAGAGSTGAINITQSLAPSVTTDKLYNVSGALTWNGIDLTAGGGISNIVEDTSPQLGGGLDVNGNGIRGATGSGAGTGGNMLIYGGNGGATGSGGYIYLTAGSGGSSGDGNGGTSYNYSGSGRGSGDGGLMLIQSGRGVDTGNGGPINITAGYGGTGGGDVTITGGASFSSQNPSAGDGGSISVAAGVGSGAGDGGDVTLISGAAGPELAGLQIVDVGGTRQGSHATGLANDATIYVASVIVDGGASQPIAITGSAAQTYTTLLSELNADTTGAVWSLTFFDLVLTSDTTGASSTIAITDGGGSPVNELFSSLVNYVAIDAAFAGTVPGSDGVIELSTGAAGIIETVRGYVAANSTGSASVVATIPLTSGDSTVFEVFAVARENSGGSPAGTESAVFRIFGGVENTGGTAAVIGSTSKDRTDDGGAAVDWDVTIGVSGGNMTITVDNDAETVDWKIKVRLTEL